MLMIAAIWNWLMTPLKNLVADAVHDALMEFAMDDPRAGGPHGCRQCGAVTECGVCAECQPMQYARLPV